MNGGLSMEAFNNWLQSVVQMVSHEGSDDLSWMLSVFVVVLITVFANYFIRKLYDRLEKHLAKTKNLWDDALLASVRKPSVFFVWLLGIGAALKITETKQDADFVSIIQPIYEVTVVVLIAWCINNFIRNVEKNLLIPGNTAEPMDETTVMAIGRLLRLSVIISAALIVMQSFGYSISGVLAFGGIGGIAVGFAAKDLLANFFGGLMLYLDRPFTIGDWIRSPDREIEGTVEHIGWRLTTIRTFDKRPLYIPNSAFMTIGVENPSRMSNRRIKETIGVRYDDASKLPVIIEQVKDLLKAHPEIDTSQTLIVNFNYFGPSSLDFFIYTFTKTTDWVFFHEIKQDVLLKVMDVITRAGAEVAFPTTTVKLEDTVEH